MSGDYDLYKTPRSKFWYYTISTPGSGRIRRSTGEVDRDKAERVRDLAKVELWKVEPALKGKTWLQAVDKWITKNNPSLTELQGIQKFNSFHGEKLLSEVSVESIDTALSKYCRTVATYNRHLWRVGGVLSASKVNLKLEPRIGDVTAPTMWITRAQWAKLYDELPAHQKSMALFAIETGLRQANVLALKWDKISLERRHMWVEGYQTKAKKPIAVPLSNAAMGVLEARPDRIGHVFTYHGQPIKDIKSAFQKACVRAGLGTITKSTDEYGKPHVTYTGFTWHGLRHTWATWHSQSGTPPQILMELGAWNDLRMVLRYAHNSAGHLARYANANQQPHQS